MDRGRNRQQATGSRKQAMKKALLVACCLLPVACCLLLEVLLCGCSVIVHGDDVQCREDADCARFQDAVCRGNICVSRSSTTTSTGSAGCVGADGCYSCPPEQNDQFLNACTDAKCAKFDPNRLTKLTADGGLPQLP